MLKKITCCTLLVFSFFCAQAQEEKILEKPLDSLYREDQFYISFSYSLMQNKPAGYTQNGFFSNVSIGFLRDFPLNKQRNIAIAPGIGYTFSTLRSNLLIIPDELKTNFPDNESLFKVLPRNEVNANRFTYHNLDIPIEFRWRTSTAASHKFLRIYTGVKFSYIFADKSIYKDGSTKYKVTNIENLNKFQTGIYMSLGYNTWNAYAYYSLTPLFKASKTNTEPVKLNALHLGLIFYIL